jgi:hypothetical protein
VEVIRVRWLLLVLALGCSVSLSAIAGQTKEKGAASTVTKHTAREVFDKIAGGQEDVITEQQYIAYEMKEHPKLTKDKIESWFKRMGGTKDKGLTFNQFKKSWEAHQAKAKASTAKKK